MKSISGPPAWSDTPKTYALVEEIQSTPISFEAGYWRLLELTRVIEFENTKLRKAKKRKFSHSGQAKKKTVAKKKQVRPKAKVARRSRA